MKQPSWIVSTIARQCPLFVEREEQKEKVRFMRLSRLLEISESCHSDRLPKMLIPLVVKSISCDILWANSLDKTVRKAFLITKKIEQRIQNRF